LLARDLAVHSSLCIDGLKTSQSTNLGIIVQPAISTQGYFNRVARGKEGRQGYPSSTADESRVKKHQDPHPQFYTPVSVVLLVMSWRWQSTLGQPANGTKMIKKASAGQDNSNLPSRPSVELNSCLFALPGLDKKGRLQSSPVVVFS
jgi:hypothetical protein